MDERNDQNLVKKPFTRRSFLKGGLALGTLAATGTIFALNNDYLGVANAEVDTVEGGWIPSCCHMCGGQSGILVKVVDGRVVKIEPNSENPIGIANISSDVDKYKKNGAKLCAKGNSGIKSLYDPDRVKKPMKRVGGKDSDRFEEISWEQAIKEIADKLNDFKQKNGPESVLWFNEDSYAVDIQKDFCAAFGTPNWHMHSNLCDVSRKAGFLLTLGTDRPLADFANTKYMLIFGWNTVGAMKWSHIPGIVTKGKEAGAKMVVVDPVFSATAAKADEWVPIKPGTDGAFAIALANVLITEGLHNLDFINQWSVGFDKYAEYVKDKTPEWAEGITGITADTIRRIARELATSKAAVIDTWSGPGHHSNATDGTRAIALLSALLGYIDQPGTLMYADRKGPKRRSADPAWPKITTPRLDGLKTKYPFAHESGIYVETREAILSGKPYQAKAGVIVMQNFVLSVPGTQRNIEALKKLELLVVVDTYMSETAKLADYVIPGSVYFERYNVNSNWVTFQSTSLTQPVIKPLYGIMPEYDFIMALARKLGLAGFDMTYEQYLDQELKDGMKISLDELKKLPGAVWTGGKTAYNKFAKEVAADKLVGTTVDEASGLVKDKDGKMVAYMKDGKAVKGFATPSGKIEFFSAQMEAKKLKGLPEFQEPLDKPTTQYPFYFTNWKQAEHTHSRTFNNEYLMEMKPSNPLWMNTQAALKLGLKEGDAVTIENQYGKGDGTVHLTEGIHPDVVGLQHGFGHWGFGKTAQGKGTNDGRFLPGKAEITSGQAITKEVGVKVTKKG